MNSSSCYTKEFTHCITSKVLFRCFRVQHDTAVCVVDRLLMAICSVQRYKFEGGVHYNFISLVSNTFAKYRMNN